MASTILRANQFRRVPGDGVANSNIKSGDTLTINSGGSLVLESGAVVTSAGAITGAEPVETVAATNVITAAESGKTFFLSSATEFVSTLPLPAAGLKYRFVIAAAPVGASYTVVTAGAPAQILAGKVFSAAGDAGDVENAATATTITFVDGQSVIGDWAEVISDGTSWFCICYASVAAGITITG